MAKEPSSPNAKTDQTPSQVEISTVWQYLQDKAQFLGMAFKTLYKSAG